MHPDMEDFCSDVSEGQRLQPGFHPLRPHTTAHFLVDVAHDFRELAKEVISV